MKITKISNEDYANIVLQCDNTTFAQLSNWGKLKETTNWRQELVGFEVEGQLIGAAQILFKQLSKTRYTIAYCGGGYSLLDDTYAQAANTALDKYLKSNNSILFKIDPQVEYKVSKHHSDEVDTTIGDQIIASYTALGFEHLGFFNEFEGMQPRHTFRINTSQDYKTTFKAMSKHTQRNIKTSRKYKSPEIIEATLEQLPMFYELLSETATRDKFSIRNYQYFEDMMKLCGDEIRLTLLKVNLADLTKEIITANEKLDRDVAKLLKKEKYSENQLDNLQTQITTNQARLEEIAIKQAQTGDITYLAGNLSINDGKNSWYLFGASASDLRFLRPPYLLMDDMIMYAIDNNLGYYDMYGVSGIFDPEHPDYGLYTYKSGFGGDLVEFIGEFDKPINKPVYFAFKNVYPKLKKMRKKKARR